MTAIDIAALIMIFLAYYTGRYIGWNAGARWATEKTAKGILSGLNDRFGWNDDKEKD